MREKNIWKGLQYVSDIEGRLKSSELPLYDSILNIWNTRIDLLGLILVFLFVCFFVCIRFWFYATVVK